MIQTKIIQTEKLEDELNKWLALIQGLLGGNFKLIDIKFLAETKDQYQSVLVIYDKRI